MIKQDSNHDLLHCEICGFPKEMWLKRPDGQMRRVHIPCDCESKKRRHIKEAQEKKEHLRQVHLLRKKAFPGSLYQTYTFANASENNSIIEKAKLYVKNFPELEAKGMGLVFWGGIGTGKTFAAGCIANALIDQEISCHMTSLPRLFQYMNSSSFEQKGEYMNKLNKCRLLIIDDLGTERNTEYSMELIYSIIDDRYVNRKPMIVTTNLSLTELNNPTDRVHDRVFSRILNMCAPVKVDEKNLRKENTSVRFQTVKHLLQQEQSV